MFASSDHFVVAGYCSLPAMPTQTMATGGLAAILEVHSDLSRSGDLPEL